MRHWARRLLLGLAFLSLAVGCSNQPETAHVSGKVMFQNKPVMFGYIMFVPLEAGKGQQKMCHLKDGTYDSNFAQETPGITPGKYDVRIEGYNGKPEPGFKPWGKQIFNQITLKADIQPGTITQDFTIPDEAGKSVRFLSTSDN
jgi:hypothetical protein